MRSLFIPALLAVAALLPAHADDTLRVAVSTAWTPPFAEFHDNALSGGFNAELGQALAQQLKRKIQFVTLPQARLDTAGASGEFDLRCQLNPDLVRQSDQYDWSPTLLSIPELLVGGRSSAPLSKPGDLTRDAAVGTLTNQRYPLMDAQFGPNGWKREDAPEPEQVLRKFSIGRSRYLLTNAFEWAWYRRTRADHNGADWRLALGFSPYQCAVPKSGRIKAAEVLAALQHLREQGQIDRLMLKHGIPTVVVVAAAGSPLPTLNRTQLDALYIGRQRSLDDGSVPLLSVLGDSNLAAFAEQVLQHDLAQLRGEWSRATFSGNGRKPRQFNNVAQMKEWLRKEPMSLGFVPSADLDSSLKLVLLQP